MKNQPECLERPNMLQNKLISILVRLVGTVNYIYIIIYYIYIIIDSTYLLFCAQFCLFDSNVIVVAIMVRPEWVIRLIEFLYILVTKTLKMVET